MDYESTSFVPQKQFKKKQYSDKRQQLSQQDVDIDNEAENLVDLDKLDDTTNTIQIANQQQ